MAKVKMKQREIDLIINLLDRIIEAPSKSESDIAFQKILFRLKGSIEKMSEIGRHELEVIK